MIDKSYFSNSFDRYLRRRFLKAIPHRLVILPDSIEIGLRKETLIQTFADGGEGAAIGAGVGAAAGAGYEAITRGDQVKVPSETLIEFTLLQDIAG
jgi:hypothetical protein